MAKSSKGSQWEREFAVRLSLWWSEGKEDDLFWRVSSSGARSTTRAKSNKRTAGGYGDICATSSGGQDLMNILVIEAKRGYTDVTFQDLLDKSTPSGKFVDFLDQTTKAASLAGVPLWLLVHRRDRRMAMAYSNLPIYIFPVNAGMMTGCYKDIQVVGVPLVSFFSADVLGFLKTESVKYGE